jgi:hypothetical protein
MNDQDREAILTQARKAHALTEASYQADPSKKGDAGWAAKQRILLADMALHLLQTSLREGELSTEDLKRNLFSILTLSDPFVPGHGLAAAGEALYPS